MVPTSNANDQLTIAGRRFNSRLFTGTGKYPDMNLMQQSIERSGCDMVTVAVRRVQTVAAGSPARAIALFTSTASAPISSA